MSRLQGKILCPEIPFFDLTDKEVTLNEKEKVIEIHCADVDELKIIRKQIIESNTKAASYALLVKNLNVFITKFMKSQKTPKRKKLAIDISFQIFQLICISDGNKTEKDLEIKS